MLPYVSLFEQKSFPRIFAKSTLFENLVLKLVISKRYIELLSNNYCFSWLIDRDHICRNDKHEGINTWLLWTLNINTNKLLPIYLTMELKFHTTASKL